jgi:hypothetical protein
VSQVLISDLSVTLAGGAVITLPHGLLSNGVATTPSEIRPNCATAIEVTASDATSVSFVNNASFVQTAIFRCWHYHSVISPLQTTLAWKGLYATTTGLSFWGRVAMVDSVNGNDATGAVDGPPFLTPAAALAAVASGDVVLVMPGTYNLAAPLVMPAGVTMVGLSHRPTILQMLGVAGATTLVTMATDCELERLTLRLTSAAHVDLTGVYFPLATGGDAHLTDCTIELDNSVAGAGSSEVYGVHSDGTAALPANIFALSDTRIRVTSVGNGKKRGILVDTAVQNFGAATAVIRVVGGADAIGAEVTFAGAQLRMEGGQVYGATADVSQTAGTLVMGTTILDNYSANGKSFTTASYGAIQCYADDGPLTNGVRYMYPGTATSSATESFVRLPQATLILGISVRARIPPGGVSTCVVTVRKNGAPTVLTLTLTGAQTTAQTSNLSVAFADTDDLSVEVNDSGATQDIMVVLSFY